MCTVTVVVSKYSEDVTWLKEVPETVKVVLYDKLDGGIPNVGREAETYLRYICTHYDTLSNYTVFLQGHPWDHLSLERAKFFSVLKDLGEQDEEKHNGRNDVYSLNNEISERWFAYNTQAPDLFKRLFETPVPPSFIFSPGAQYIVSRNSIRHRTLCFYKTIWDAMFTHDVSYSGSSLVDPWTIERVWRYIFTPHIPSKSTIAL